MAIVLRHATLAQLGAAFRGRYRDARGEQAAKLARWLLARITDGTFTDTQVRNFFGLTTPQYNTLKTKLQAQADTLTTLEASAGE